MTNCESLRTIERDWSAPPVTMSSRLDGELLEVSMGPQHPSTHGVFRMNVALEGEIVRKLKPVFGYLHRNHEQIGENTTLSRLDAVHRSARLFLLDDEQLGLRAQRRKTRRHRSSRARRIFARDPGRTDATAKSRVAARIFAERHGRVGHAVDVCVSRTRKNSRSLRIALRLADDVRLHAVRRLPGRRRATNGSRARNKLSIVSRSFSTSSRN